MKKLFASFLLVLFIILPLSAANMQKTYLMSDEIWQQADRLCRMNGVLGPVPVSPTTGAEIMTALNRLNYNSLPASHKAIYDNIIQELEASTGFAYKDDQIELDPSISLNPQFYAFNNTKDTYASEFFLQYRDRQPLLKLELESSILDNIYFYFQYNYMDNPVSFELDESTNTVKAGPLFYNFSNMASILNPSLDGSWMGYLAKKKKGNIAPNLLSYQPLKAGISAGNSFFNVFLGRSRQTFGNGITGNLVIGDNFSYQELLKVSVNTNVFNYQLSLTHFDNAEDKKDFQFSGIHQLRSIQRIDLTFLNKIRFALNIGAHIMSTNMFDWRMIMPMMLVHNWNNNSEDIETTPNNGDEINNILGIELEWVVNNYLTLTGQVVIDQFRLPVEKNSVVPSAHGVILNAKVITPVKSGTFDSWIELVYTNPYLYLNKKTWIENSTDCYYLDHIAGYWYDQSNAGEINYLGHSFGPDTFAISVGTNYIDKKSWGIKGSILYKIHGEKGISPKGYWYGNNNIDNRNDDGNAKTPSGTAEHTLKIQIDSGYKIKDNLTVSMSIANIFSWNYQNQKDIFKNSIQAGIGLKWIIF